MNFRDYLGKIAKVSKYLILAGTNFGEFCLNLPISPKLVLAKIRSLKVESVGLVRCIRLDFGRLSCIFDLKTPF